MSFCFCFRYVVFSDGVSDTGYCDGGIWKFSTLRNVTLLDVLYRGLTGSGHKRWFLSCLVTAAGNPITWESQTEGTCIRGYPELHREGPANKEEGHTERTKIQTRTK